MWYTIFNACTIHLWHIPIFRDERIKMLKNGPKVIDIILKSITDKKSSLLEGIAKWRWMQSRSKLRNFATLQYYFYNPGSPLYTEGTMDAFRVLVNSIYQSFKEFKVKNCTAFAIYMKLQNYSSTRGTQEV